MFREILLTRNINPLGWVSPYSRMEFIWENLDIITRIYKYMCVCKTITDCFIITGKDKVNYQYNKQLHLLN